MADIMTDKLCSNLFKKDIEYILIFKEKVYRCVAFTLQKDNIYHLFNTDLHLLGFPKGSLLTKVTHTFKKNFNLFKKFLIRTDFYNSLMIIIQDTSTFSNPELEALYIKLLKEKIPPHDDALITLPLPPHEGRVLVTTETASILDAPLRFSITTRVIYLKMDFLKNAPEKYLVNIMHDMGYYSDTMPFNGYFISHNFNIFHRNIKIGEGSSVR